MIKIDVHNNGTMLSLLFPAVCCETLSWFDSDGGKSGWPNLTDSSAATTLLFTFQLPPNHRKEIKKKVPAAHSSVGPLMNTSKWINSELVKFLNTH